MYMHIYIYMCVCVCVLYCILLIYVLYMHYSCMHFIVYHQTSLLATNTQVLSHTYASCSGAE